MMRNQRSSQWATRELRQGDNWPDDIFPRKKEQYLQIRGYRKTNPTLQFTKNLSMKNTLTRRVKNSHPFIMSRKWVIRAMKWSFSSLRHKEREGILQYLIFSSHFTSLVQYQNCYHYFPSLSDKNKALCQNMRLSSRTSTIINISYRRSNTTQESTNVDHTPELWTRSRFEQKIQGPQSQTAMSNL